LVESDFDAFFQLIERRYSRRFLNLGKKQAKLKLGLNGVERISATNLFTGNSIGPEFKLNPKGVLLLEITPN
jgi:hypothetical protein